MHLCLLYVVRDCAGTAGNATPLMIRKGANDIKRSVLGFLKGSNIQVDKFTEVSEHQNFW